MNTNSNITLVDASAGTGKTFHITKTVVESIKSGIEIHQVFVVTYTEKAASEMRSRIRQGIEKEMSEEDLMPAHTNLLLDALSRFDEAAIGTIHSISHELLQTYSVEHGLVIPSKLTGSDSELCDELVEAKILDLLGEDQDSSWHRLISRTILGDVRSILRSVVTEMITYCGDDQNTQRSSDLELYLYTHQEVGASVEITSISREEYRESFSRRYDEAIRKLKELLKHSKITSKAYLPNDTTVNFIASLFARSLTKSSGTKFNNLKSDEKDPEIETLFKDILKDLWHIFNVGIEPSNIQKDAGHWKSRFLDKILSDYIFNRESNQDLIAQIQLRKSSVTEVSFDELLVLFSRASEVDAFSDALSDRYKLICIDEFQDTNLLQWSAFKRIFSREGCRLLLVGDPKQAIYSFRGGDVHTYKEVQNSGDVQDGKSLECNFRSTPPLIASLNKLFDKQRLSDGPLSGYQDFEANPVKYPAKVKCTSKSPNGEIKLISPLLDGKLRLRSIMPSAESSNELHKVAWLTNHVGHFVADDILSYLEREHRANRPAKLSDCAVLVNKNSEAKTIQQSIAQWGIKSALVLDESVYRSEAAQYLVLWLDALLNLDDESKVAGALMTPFFGYSHSEALEQAGQTPQRDSARHALEAQAERWLDSGQPLKLISKYERTLDDNQKASRHVLQLMKRPRGHEQMLNLEHLLTLIQRAAESQSLSPSAQLNYLRAMVARRLAEDPTKIDCPDGEVVNYQLETDAVQIMTIHKSKGLGFEAVFCPFAWNKMRDAEVGRMIKATAPIKSSINPSKRSAPLISDSLDQSSKSAELYIGSGLSELKPTLTKETNLEKLNKLYVAFTRAKRELFLYYALANSHEKSNNMSLGLIGYKDGQGAKLESCTSDKCKANKLCIGCKHLSLHHQLEQLSGKLIVDRDDLRTMVDLPTEYSDEILDQIFESTRDSVEYQQLCADAVPSPMKERIKAISTDSESFELTRPSDQALEHNNYWGTWSFSSIFSGKINTKGKSKSAPRDKLQGEKARGVREDDEFLEQDIDLEEHEREVKRSSRSNKETTTDTLRHLLSKQERRCERLLKEHRDLPAPLLDPSSLPIGLRAAMLGNYIHELFELWDLEAKRLDCLHGARQDWEKLSWPELHIKHFDQLPVLKRASLARAVIDKMKSSGQWTHTDNDVVEMSLVDQEGLFAFLADLKNARDEIPPEGYMYFNPMQSAADEAHLCFTLIHDLTQMALTPLGGPMRNTSLATLEPADVIHELEFDFAVGRGLTEKHFTQVSSVIDLDQTQTLDKSFTSELIKLQARILSARETKISGMMTGSIDLIFRKEIKRRSQTSVDEPHNAEHNADGVDHDARATRYFIADYKTNLITFDQQENQSELSDTERAIAYEPHHLAVKMIASHYHLQAHIYLVALHRYLKARLGDHYDYDKDVGGYYYLFCRGMTGPQAAIIDRLHTSDHFAKSHEGSLGVYYYRPSREVIESLSSDLSLLTGMNSSSGEEGA